MITYVGHPMETAKKETRINEFTKGAVHRINVQKSTAFVETGNEWLESEIKKQYYNNSIKTQNI